MARIVVGLFDDFNNAQAAVRDLVDAGFPREDISLIANDVNGEYKNNVNQNATYDRNAYGKYDTNTMGTTAWQNDFNENYANTDYTYNDYLPAYQYGDELRRNPRYQGWDWNRIEPEARRGWAERYPDNDWNDYQGAVRTGYGYGTTGTVETGKAYDARATSATDETSDTAAGAGIGAVLGGLGGLLIGLGALAIPGVGPVLAAGPIVATLVGAGVGAAAGGLIGALVDAGVPEEQANLYAEGVRRGGTLVTVSTSDQNADRAVGILNDHDPVDIDRRASQWHSDNWTGFDENAEPYTREQVDLDRNRYGDLDEEGEVDIPVVEEEMRVGKRQVAKGGVRVHTFMTEKPVSETVNLREENVHVNREKVDRPASEEDLDSFEEGTMVIEETGEEAVADKQARVVEEVHIDKDVQNRQETVKDTVRRTGVEVDEMDADEMDMDEDDFEPIWRNHFNNTYSSTDYSYNDYLPAYQYGNELGTNQNYQGWDWNRVEPEARRGWAERYPDYDWNEYQDAVREGYYSRTRGNA